MKRLLLILAALVGVGAAGLAFGQAADGPDGLGILGSPHDFSDNLCYQSTSYAPGDAPTAKTYDKVCDETGAGTGWNDTGQVCKVCHTPHAPSTNNDIGVLLWNHDDSAATGWTMYDSASLDATAATEPTGLALACLGCHDGIQGIDIFGSHIGSAADEIINGTGSIYPSGTDELTYGILSGTDIDQRRDHPVSVEYDTADPDLFATTEVKFGTRQIGQVLEDIGGTLTIQCHSCHDVHNNSTADQWLLRLNVLDQGDGGASEASELCLACHDK